jgi:ABC-type uncharacterized transport system auxiliary subunit
MRADVTALLSVLVLGAGCVHRPAAPAPPHDVHVVTVLPPANRTGDGLLIAGTSLLERYAFRTERVTVPDALATETASFLRARGYRVEEPATVESALHGRAPETVEEAGHAVSAAGLEGFALYWEIRRWEADADTHPAFVIVGVSASLIDATNGRVVWSVRRPVRPVPTPGAVTLGAAYDIAVQSIVAELLASW